MQGASPELRWGHLNWAGDGSEAGPKPWLWSTSKREYSKRDYTLVDRNYWTRYGEVGLFMRDEETLVLIPSTKQTTKILGLRFYALLTDGTREVRLRYA